MKQAVRADSIALVTKQLKDIRQLEVSCDKNKSSSAFAYEYFKKALKKLKKQPTET